MTICRCDICKKQVDRLITLVDDYKVDRISEACESCVKEIDELLDKIRKAQLVQRENFMRRVIKSMIKN